MSDITLSFWLGIAVIFQVTSVFLFYCKGTLLGLRIFWNLPSSIQEMSSAVL